MKKLIYPFLLFFAFNASAQLDSIAGNLPQLWQAEDTTYSVDWESLLVSVYLELETVYNMPVWSCEDLERAYYARLDYIDLLIRIGGTNNRYMSEEFKAVLIWCTAIELDLFERINEEL